MIKASFGIISPQAILNGVASAPSLKGKLPKEFLNEGVCNSLDHAKPALSLLPHDFSKVQCKVGFGGLTPAARPRLS